MVLTDLFGVDDSVAVQDALQKASGRLTIFIERSIASAFAVMKLTPTIYTCLTVTSTLVMAQNITGDWQKRLDVELFYPRTPPIPLKMYYLSALPSIISLHSGRITKCQRLSSFWWWFPSVHT
jgi:hypothetical protein